MLDCLSQEHHADLLPTSSFLWKVTHHMKRTHKRHCMIVHATYPLGESRVERQASALVGSGYEVDIICLRGANERGFESENGVSIYRLPVKRHKGRGALLQLLEYLAFFLLAFSRLLSLYPRRRYGVVQVHNLPDFLIFCALVPKLGGARLILDLHDLMPEFFAGSYHKSMNSWPVRLLIAQEQLSCRFADHVITVSEHWRQRLIKRGVPPSKCSVVMNVADDNVFHPLADGEPTPLRDSRFGLIYHGTVVERYGLDLAIQAVDQVRHDVPGLHLTILGKGGYIETLTRMVEQRNLTHHVAIYDEMRPVQELPQIIRRADLGIVPYRNDAFTDELVPTKLMEYAALGLPAIAARTSAIEAYFSGTMAELFTPGDVNDLARCIRALWRSPQRLAELARGSEKFNYLYNWARLGAEYVALVERLGNR